MRRGHHREHRAGRAARARLALLLAPLLALLLCACSAATLRQAPDAGITPLQQQRIAQARRLAQQAVFDPRFARVLSSMAISDFDCAPCRDGDAPRPSGNNILELIRRRGLFGADAIRIKKSVLGKSLPLAVTDPCGDATYLNADLLDRDAASIANTLVHERMHAYCYVHVAQYRDRAYCDPSYVVGDLAEVVLRYRHALGSSGPVAVRPVAHVNALCPSLCRALAREGVAAHAGQCQT